MTKATRQEAAQAKEEVIRLMAADDNVVGVGLTKVDDGYAVRVNLHHGISHPLTETARGVPVVYEIVGELRAGG